MGPWIRMAAAWSAAVVGQVRGTIHRRPPVPVQPGLSRWLGEPRNAVFLVLAAALVLGGGRKLLQWWRARTAVKRLGEPEPSVASIEEAASHGRAGLIDLFRILGTAESAAVRTAAGRALATLWAQDNLIVEEEKALVLRGFEAHWHARRRYPRALRAPIPIIVTYGVPFLDAGGPGVGSANLEWSHRVLGTRRMALEAYSPWTTGPARTEFALIPSDFDTNGPHRLILHARVRTAGLTDTWELDLPQTTFHFEFDGVLAPDALFALDDATRAEQFARAVTLEPGAAEDAAPADYLALGDQWALRAPPSLAVATPLPCDLAHTVELEFEEVKGRFAAGAVVLGGQGEVDQGPPAITRFALGPVPAFPSDALDRPGTRRLRAILTPDPDRGWADPTIRSIWPGTIETGWAEVQVVRR
jgi:hypothetical protein